jgi:hypothetical protein
MVDLGVRPPAHTTRTHFQVAAVEEGGAGRHEGAVSGGVQAGTRIEFSAVLWFRLATAPLALSLLSGRRCGQVRKGKLLVVLMLLLGCSAPSEPAQLAARHARMGRVEVSDSWCKLGGWSGRQPLCPPCL